MHNFCFFDPSQDYDITFGDLPHWEQPGATIFVTFRTADSIPNSAIELWQRERCHWLQRQGIDSTRPDWKKQFRRLSHDLQRQFNRTFAATLEASLDELHGQCLLRRPELAQIVSDALHHFNGVRYCLGDFVVMPNHVHLLVCFFDGIRLRDQCRSWKHYTARQINRVLGTGGRFWQTESFDHLVRDLEHFERFQRYIADNPHKAGLAVGEYVHYSIGNIA
jgi:menaquinone-specific isochorismate synthase